MILREKAVKFMKLAKIQADMFSKDPNKKVGCILLAPNSLQILSCGYNGIPRKMKETDERWRYPSKHYYVVHSETNALYNACRHGVAVEGAIAVVTMFPCSGCARALIQSGIIGVVSMPPDFSHPRWGEEFRVSMDMFSEVGVDVVLLDERELV
jgi:dCMP deaminase